MCSSDLRLREHPAMRLAAALSAPATARKSAESRPAMAGKDQPGSLCERSFPVWLPPEFKAEGERSLPRSKSSRPAPTARHGDPRKQQDRAASVQCHRRPEGRLREVPTIIWYFSAPSRLHQHDSFDDRHRSWFRVSADTGPIAAVKHQRGRSSALAHSDQFVRPARQRR